MEHDAGARNSSLHGVELTGRGEGEHNATVELVSRLILGFDATHMDEVHVLESEKGLVRV